MSFPTVLSDVPPLKINSLESVFKGRFAKCALTSMLPKSRNNASASAPETAPESTPETAPESASESAPESTPESAPESASEEETTKKNSYEDYILSSSVASDENLKFNEFVGSLGALLIKADAEEDSNNLPQFDYISGPKYKYYRKTLEDAYRTAHDLGIWDKLGNPDFIDSKYESLLVNNLKIEPPCFLHEIVDELIYIASSSFDHHHLRFLNKVEQDTMRDKMNNNSVMMELDKLMSYLNIDGGLTKICRDELLEYFESLRQK